MLLQRKWIKLQIGDEPRQFSLAKPALFVSDSDFDSGNVSDQIANRL